MIPAHNHSNSGWLVWVQWGLLQAMREQQFLAACSLVYTVRLVYSGTNVGKFIKM
jgi:hypothetical protein